MNRDLLKRLEIDESLGLKEMLSELEAKQYELLERSQSTSDASRQQELEQLSNEIDIEISQIKEEIQSAGSALIFDEGQPEEEAPAAAPEPEEDAMEDKIEQLRQQEEERAAAMQQQAEAQAQAQIDSAQQAALQMQQQQQVSNLAAGVAAFKRQNFAEAFQYFSPLAEQNEPNAQHFLSMMYHDGMGMQADWEGFDFWSKKAVENGNTVAMEYRANMLLKDGNGKGDHVGKAAKQCYLEALDLLEKAGGPDNLTPLETYIGIVELRADKSIDPKLTAIRSCLKGDHVKKAMDFCQVISDNIPDSYKKKQWLDRKEAIRKNKPYRIQGAVDAQTAAAQSQQQNYKPYRPKKRPSCGCIIGILIALYILTAVLAPSILNYAKKSKSLNAENGTETAEVQEEAIPYGGARIALTDVPEEYLGTQERLTLRADNEYVIGSEMWMNPMVFRAGNGGDTAYAEYILDGKFGTLELSAAPHPDHDNFMQSTHVALRVVDVDSGEIFSETIIGSDPVATLLNVDVSGRRAIRIAVSLVDGGNGFANLGYTLVKDAYLSPAEDGNAEDGNAEDAPTEEALQEEPVY